MVEKRREGHGGRVSTGENGVTLSGRMKGKDSLRIHSALKTTTRILAYI